MNGSTNTEEILKTGCLLGIVFMCQSKNRCCCRRNCVNSNEGNNEEKTCLYKFSFMEMNEEIYN